MQGDYHLAMPHLDVESIALIRWKALHSMGYKGVVFDKDNTLTLPYQLQLHKSVAKAFLACQSTFNNQIVIFSNSAGTTSLWILAMSVHAHHVLGSRFSSSKFLFWTGLCPTEEVCHNRTQE
jgi:predicted HAD superfamily phosphohydrolase YqeG